MCRAIPGISEEQLDAILAQRGLAPPDPLLDELPPELLEELATGKEVQELEDRPGAGVWMG